MLSHSISPIIFQIGPFYLAYYSLIYIIASILVLYILIKQPKIVFLGFALGILIDIFQVRYIGSTALFFTISLFTIFLYERKFEIRTVPFVFVSSLLGSIFYLWIFGGGRVLEQALITSIIMSIIFPFINNKQIEILRN